MAAMAAIFEFWSEWSEWYFWSPNHPDASYRGSSQLAFQFMRRSQKFILRWQQWRQSWIYERNNFTYFWSTSHRDASYQVSSQLAFQFRRRSKKVDFQDSGHLGFPIGTAILAVFYLQITRCFLPSFKSVGLLVQEKKWKIDFQDGSPGSHFGFPIRTILAIFHLQVTLMLPTKFQVN